MDSLTSYFVVAIHDDALLAFHVGDSDHPALYFGAELSVVVDPAFHAGEDIQSKPEGD